MTAEDRSVGQLIDDLSAPMGKARAALNAHLGLILSSNDRAWLLEIVMEELARADAMTSQPRPPQ